MIKHCHSIKKPIHMYTYITKKLVFLFYRIYDRPLQQVDFFVGLSSSIPLILQRSKSSLHCISLKRKVVLFSSKKYS